MKPGSVLEKKLVVSFLFGEHLSANNRTNDSKCRKFINVMVQFLSTSTKSLILQFVNIEDLIAQF